MIQELWNKILGWDGQIDWLWTLAIVTIVGLIKNSHFIGRVKGLFRGKADAYKYKAINYRISTIPDMYDKMQSLVETSPYKQALIFRVTNSGGDLGPHTQMFITCLHEVTRHPIKEEKPNYEYPGVPMDEEQLRVAAGLIQSDMFIRTQDLPDGPNKRRLEEKGVKCSHLFHVTIRTIPRKGRSDGEEIHFAVLNSIHDVDDETAFGKISDQATKSKIEYFKSHLRKCYG